MLRSTNDLEGFAIHAIDGLIGHVRDFYFDDAAWVIRYLVVDIGHWLPGRKVLISPIAIGRPNWTQRELPVSITREQVKNSPDIETEKPVSRQHEIRYFKYYGYPYYWGGAGLWGGGAWPTMMVPGYADFASTPRSEPTEAEREYLRAEAVRHRNDDPRLRSCIAVMRYHVQATDGDIGHVQGLLVDQETWAIRYIIVDTSNWWLGQQVLIAPTWIHNVNWQDATVTINLTRQAVKAAPPYDAMAALDRDQERDIHEHYGRPGYWLDEVVRDADKFGDQ